jgi:hypothetical protein
LLTAIAVLACSALAQADNLPPVPKSEIKIVADQPTLASAKSTEIVALSPVPDKATAKVEAMQAVTDTYPVVNMKNTTIAWLILVCFLGVITLTIIRFSDPVTIHAPADRQRQEDQQNATTWPI